MADARLVVAPRDSPAEAPAALPVGIEPVHALHLVQGRALQDLRASRRVLRPVAKLQLGEAGEVLDGGREVGCRHHVGRVEERLDAARRAGQAAPVAGRERRHVPGRDDARRGHAERLQDVARDVVGVWLARHLLDDVAGERDGDVRVLVVGLRRPDDAHAVEQTLHLLARGKLQVVPIRSVHLAGETRGVGQEVADRDQGAARVDVRRGELREPLRHRVVELELARVAQLQDGRRGEELGERRDAIVRRGRGGRLLREIRKAVPLRPDQLLIVHDADRDSRLLPIGGGAGDPRVVDRDGGGDTGVLGQRLRRLGGAQGAGQDEQGDQKQGSNRGAAGREHAEGPPSGFRHSVIRRARTATTPTPSTGPRRGRARWRRSRPRAR